MNTSGFQKCFARVVLPACGVLVSALAHAQSTNMFRGGPAHTGTYSSLTTPSLSNVAWKYKAGGKFISTPAVHNGVVFAGNSDRNIYAVNASDGSLSGSSQQKVRSMHHRQ